MVQAAGMDAQCLALIFYKEHPTLGISPQFMIVKNPDMESCPHTRIHLSEDRSNLQVQTWGVCRGCSSSN